MPTPLENLATAARDSGVPKDQLENFLYQGYVPLPWQLKFHAACRIADTQNGPVKVGVGGARGPGKSHAVFSQVALDDCKRVGNLKALFLRQTGKSAQESLEDLVDKTLRGKTHFDYNPSRGRVSFKNNSRVLLGGFETERDVDKYIGIEYDIIAIEELNQLTEQKVIKLLGSLRTSKPNWRPRFYASFNPGGIGHEFVKGWFVIPFREKLENQTRFIPSTYRDNPFLNAEYIQYLEGITGSLGRAWREGDWDMFEGQYFSEWRHEKHVIYPFEIPIGWKRFRSYDHGRENPACCLWFAIDFDSRVWCYRELYVTGRDVDDIGKEIARLSGNEIYDYSVADPSIFSKLGFVDRYGGQTIAEGLSRHGATFFPASNRRVDGWTLMHQYLRWDDHIPPKLMFFSTCHNSIRTIPTLIHDDLHPEDLDTKGEDHAADAIRYMLASLHEKVIPTPLNEVEKKLKEIRDRSNIQSRLNDLYSGEMYRRG